MKSNSNAKKGGGALFCFGGVNMTVILKFRL